MLLPEITLILLPKQIYHYISLIKSVFTVVIFYFTCLYPDLIIKILLQLRSSLPEVIRQVLYRVSPSVFINQEISLPIANFFRTDVIDENKGLAA